MPGPRRILIIDSDPNLGRTLTLMLEHAGYAVTAADVEQTALTSLEMRVYDLIVLDVASLDQSGRDVLLQLRQCCACIPVLVLIGQDLSGLDTELRQRGANAILYKPFDAENLLAQVVALLRPKCLPGP
jgi:DNA-binding response OmpR family regulator